MDNVIILKVIELIMHYCSELYESFSKLSRRNFMEAFVQISTDLRYHLTSFHYCRVHYNRSSEVSQKSVIKTCLLWRVYNMSLYALFPSLYGQRCSVQIQWNSVIATRKVSWLITWKQWKLSGLKWSTEILFCRFYWTLFRPCCERWPLFVTHLVNS